MALEDGGRSSTAPPKPIGGSTGKGTLEPKFKLLRLALATVMRACDSGEGA
jgi:hypothetical protein